MSAVSAEGRVVVVVSLRCVRWHGRLLDVKNFGGIRSFGGCLIVGGGNQRWWLCCKLIIRFCILSDAPSFVTKNSVANVGFLKYYT